MKTKQENSDESPPPAQFSTAQQHIQFRIALDESVATVATAVEWVADEFYEHNNQPCESKTGLYSCGQNDYGELAHGDTSPRLSFTRVEVFDNKQIVSIGAGTCLQHCSIAKRGKFVVYDTIFDYLRRQ